MSPVKHGSAIGALDPACLGCTKRAIVIPVGYYLEGKNRNECDKASTLFCNQLRDIAPNLSLVNRKGINW
jgi:hypothetical protein